MNWLALIALFIGGFLGLLIGCLLAANRMSELRDEIGRLRRKLEDRQSIPD